MISAFSLSRRRSGAPVLLALALGLAACGDDSPPPALNEVEATEGAEEVLPPVVEPVAVPEPVENSVDDTVANAVGLEEEELPVDQQMLEDAATTGMTSRYTGDDAGNDGAPVE